MNLTTTIMKPVSCAHEKSHNNIYDKGRKGALKKYSERKSFQLARVRKTSKIRPVMQLINFVPYVIR
jgi:hypothetical protein